MNLMLILGNIQACQTLSKFGHGQLGYETVLLLLIEKCLLGKKCLVVKVQNLNLVKKMSFFEESLQLGQLILND